MPGQPRKAQPGTWADIPLPGMHPCLTWQLNVTLYPQPGLGKFVSILRDPDAQVELARNGTNVEIREDMWPRLVQHLQECRLGLLYLAQWKDPTPI